MHFRFGAGEVVLCLSSLAQRAREGIGSIICHLRAYKHEHSHTTHTHQITFLRVDRMVVLEQRGAKNTVKNKTCIRFLPQFSLHFHSPQFFVG